MSFNYKSTNFLASPTPDDKRMKIYDKNRNLKYSIEPDLSYFYISSNCIIVKITNKNDIVLTFANEADTKLAMERLKTVKLQFGENTIDTGIGDVEFTDLTQYDYMIYYGGKWINTHDLVLPSNRYLYIGKWRLFESDDNLKVEVNTTGTTWIEAGEFFV